MTPKATKSGPATPLPPPVMRKPLTDVVNSPTRSPTPASGLSPSRRRRQSTTRPREHLEPRHARSRAWRHPLRASLSILTSLWVQRRSTRGDRSPSNDFHSHDRTKQTVRHPGDGGRFVKCGTLSDRPRSRPASSRPSPRVRGERPWHQDAARRVRRDGRSERLPRKPGSVDRRSQEPTA